MVARDGDASPTPPRRATSRAAAWVFAACALGAHGASAQPRGDVRLRLEVDPALGGCVDEADLRQGLREFLVHEGLAAAGDDTPEEFVVSVVLRGARVEATLRWAERGRDGRLHATPISVPQSQCSDLRAAFVVMLRALRDVDEPAVALDAGADVTDAPPPDAPPPDDVTDAAVAADVAVDDAPPITTTVEVPIAAFAVGTVSFGTTPTVALGAGAGVQLGRDRWRASAAVHWSRPWDDDVSTRSDVTLAMDRWSLWLRGCYGSPHLGVCLVADVAALVYRTAGPAAIAMTTVAQTVTVGVGGEAVLLPRSPVALRVSLDVMVNVLGVQSRFEALDRTPEFEPLWRSPWVGVILGVAPLFRIR